MTAWTSIANGDIDPESPITTSLVTALRDNPSAIAEGATGAPLIQEAALDAAIVSQAKLKTASGEIFSSLNQNTVLPGGEYGFYPQVKEGSTLHEVYFQIAHDVTSTYRTLIYTEVISGTGYVQQRYIQASPPYDLGDGAIPMFVFALLNKNGEAVSGYVAEEAPWHLNGPTNIQTQKRFDGKPFRIRKNMGKNKMSLKDAMKSKGDIQKYVETFASALPDYEEITQEMKQADMDLIPHPFGIVKPDQTVVILDPVSDLTHTLAEMQKAHDEFSLCEILNSGYLKIDNNPLNRKCPKGVMPVHYTWR